MVLKDYLSLVIRKPVFAHPLSLISTFVVHSLDSIISVVAMY